jgi:hypothetical protein
MVDLKQQCSNIGRRGQMKGFFYVSGVLDVLIAPCSRRVDQTVECRVLTPLERVKHGQSGRGPTRARG